MKQIQIVTEVLLELERMKKRIEEYKDKSIGEDGEWDYWNIIGTKEAGAIKRAAIDLKNSLTKITKW